MMPTCNFTDPLVSLNIDHFKLFVHQGVKSKESLSFLNGRTVMAISPSRTLKEEELLKVERYAKCVFAVGLAHLLFWMAFPLGSSLAPILFEANVIRFSVSLLVSFGLSTIAFLVFNRKKRNLVRALKFPNLEKWEIAKSLDSDSDLLIPKIKASIQKMKRKSNPEAAWNKFVRRRKKSNYINLCAEIYKKGYKKESNDFFNYHFILGKLRAKKKTLDFFQNSKITLSYEFLQ